MAARNPRTTWIVAVAAVVVVVAASVAVIVVSLKDRPPTEQVETTTVPPTITTSTTVPTTSGEGSTTTTVPAEVDEEEVVLRIGDGERGYLAIAPRRIQAGEHLPVVMVLHGLGVDARHMSWVADWRQAVERDRFLAVFPQGVANSWNMGPCCPPANLGPPINPAPMDDFGFLDEVVDDVRGRSDVDPDRMYLTGFSNGGIMTYAYACHRPDAFAAIAPMASSNLTRCVPSEPLSLLHQHSDPDSVVPFDGRPTLSQLISAVAFPAVPESVENWAVRSGCDAGPREEVDGDEVETFTWQGCPDGMEVELVRIPGRGHTWPDLGDYDPLDELLRFFDIG